MIPCTRKSMMIGGWLDEDEDGDDDDDGEDNDDDVLTLSTCNSPCC